MPVKVMRIEDAPIRVMRWDRGKALRLVDEADGAKNVDVHINLINVDSGPGPTHYHAKAENIYVVLEGTVEAIVAGKKVSTGSGRSGLYSTRGAPSSRQLRRYRRARPGDLRSRGRRFSYCR